MRGSDGEWCWEKEGKAPLKKHSTERERRKLAGRYGTEEVKGSGWVGDEGGEKGGFWESTVRGKGNAVRKGRKGGQQWKSRYYFLVVCSGGIYSKEQGSIYTYDSCRLPSLTHRRRPLP